MNKKSYMLLAIWMRSSQERHRNVKHYGLKEGRKAILPGSPADTGQIDFRLGHYLHVPIYWHTPAYASIGPMPTQNGS